MGGTARRGQFCPRLADKAERPLDGVAIGIGQAERHVRGQPRHAEAALGIERQPEAALALHVGAVGVGRLLRPQGGGVSVPVSFGHDKLAVGRAALRPAEHGDYA